MGGDQLARAALEEFAPLGGHGVGILEVVLEQEPGVARVQAVDIVCAHSVCCTNEPVEIVLDRVWAAKRPLHPALIQRIPVMTAIVIPSVQQMTLAAIAKPTRRRCRSDMRAATNASKIAKGMSRTGRYASPTTLVKIETVASNPAIVSTAVQRARRLDARVDAQAVTFARTEATRPGTTQASATPRQRAAAQQADATCPPVALRPRPERRKRADTLERLGLGPDRPPNHPAEVHDRDLQHEQHEHELPDHRAILGHQRSVDSVGRISPVPLPLVEQPANTSTSIST